MPGSPEDDVEGPLDTEIKQEIASLLEQDLESDELHTAVAAVKRAWRKGRGKGAKAGKGKGKSRCASCRKEDRIAANRPLPRVVIQDLSLIHI